MPTKVKSERTKLRGKLRGKVRGKSEFDTQRRVIKLFTKELGYRFLGNWSDRLGNSNIEEGYLYANLAKAGYSESHANAAVYQLQLEATNTNRSLYENNQAVYRLLRYGVDVKTVASKPTEKVWLVNWKEPEKNQFAIAEEVTLKSGHERRPDLVLYINGIAIGTIELKSSRVSIVEGIRQSLLIVVDKLLTGFDAPCCTYLYIDKSMQDHGLFQAICRTNRLDGDDKDFGYIVDYTDLFKKVENAIAVYLSELDKSDDANGPSEVLLKDRLLGDIDIDVIHKDIKNLHLSVHPPMGRVRIAAPSRMKLENIRLYAISKLDWIKTQRKQLREQQRETPREYLERESHYVWGKRYLLKVIEHDAPPTIELKHRNLIIRVRPETTQAKRQQLIDDWYREQVRTAAALLIEKWQPILKVKACGFYVQRMKTRWGSCNTEARTIRINSELGKKESECLEYIVVHEMVHLLERSHNDRVRRLMDKFYPKWSHVRMQLNRAPLSHTEWVY